MNPTASPSKERKLRAVCAELAHRVGQGEDCRAEDYLVFWGDDLECALEIIYAEFLARQHLPEPAPIAHWLERFPIWREELDRLFEVHEVAGETVAPSESDTPAGRLAPVFEGSLGSILDGRYEILRELGRGGMGVVYQARQLQLDRIVALKLMRLGAFSPESDVRFRTEAEAVARLQHPNIVQIYEVGEHNGTRFLSMEYVAGERLDKAIADSAFTPAQAGQLLTTLAHAMQHAHDAGILHRDLKPANVLVTKEGVPKIADFGLAKVLPSNGRGQLQGHESACPENLTQTGVVLGTPAYMSPEQAQGRNEAVGTLTDVHALGAILYEMLTSRPPFSGATPMEIIDEVRSRDPIPPRQRRGDVPKDLETICLKCLAKDPLRRYASAAKLAEDLRRFQSGEAILGRRTRVIEKTVSWCRRKPLLAGLIATLVLVTCTSFGAIVSLWNDALNQAVLATERERKAQFEQQRADELLGRTQTHLERTQRVVEELANIQRNIVDQPLTEDVQYAATKQMLALYESLLVDNSDEMSRRRAIARFISVGDLQRRLGKSAESMATYQRAIEITQMNLKGSPEHFVDTYNQVTCQVRIGDILGHSQLTDDAMVWYERARATLESTLQNARVRHPDLLMQYGHLLLNVDCRQALQRDDLEEAERVCKQVIACQTEASQFYVRHLVPRLEELSDSDRKWIPKRQWSELAMALNQMAEIAVRQGNPDRAEKLCRRGLKIRQWTATASTAGPLVQNGRMQLRRIDNTPKRADQRHLASSYATLARALARLRPTEASEMYLRGLEIQEQVVRDFPLGPHARSDLGNLLVQYGQFQRQQGLEAAAQESLVRARQVFLSLMKNFPHEVRFRERWQELHELTSPARRPD